MEEKMRKISTLLLLFFAMTILSTSAFAASVSRSMPSRVSPGEDINMVLSVSGATAGQIFTLEEQAPQGWRVDNWNVAGAKGGKEAVEYRFVAADNRHGFSFTAESASPVITFTVKVPTTAANGNYAFDAVYFDSSGQSRSQGTVTVRTVTCGDGTCEGSENTENCAADCPAAPAPVVSPPETPTGPPAILSPENAGKASIAGIVVLVIVAAIAVFLYTKRKKPGM